MSKSIMQIKDGRCYLCNLIGDYREKQVQEHHCFGGPNRSLSEHYGLKVYLCLAHHTMGREAVHMNAETRSIIQKDAQRAFELKHPKKNFREIFGKNYL